MLVFLSVRQERTVTGLKPGASRLHFRPMQSHNNGLVRRRLLAGGPGEPCDDFGILVVKPKICQVQVLLTHGKP